MLKKVEDKAADDDLLGQHAGPSKLT